MVAVAIGGAVIGGVSNIVGGSIAASGAQKAAQTTAAAQQAATQASLDMFNQAQATEAPYVSGGDAALTELQGEISGALPVPGQPGVPLSSVPSLTDITTLPGYSFTLDQGLKATQNAAAAQGLGVSGVALKGASTYAENLANTFYNNYLSNYWTNQNNRYNALYNQVVTGQAAAGQTAQAATASGGQQASAITQGAANTAAYQAAGANALAGSVSGLGSNVNNALIANALLGNTSSGSTLTQPTGYSGLNASQINAVNSQGFYYGPGASWGSG